MLRNLMNTIRAAILSSKVKAALPTAKSTSTPVDGTLYGELTQLANRLSARLLKRPALSNNGLKSVEVDPEHQRLSLKSKRLPVFEATIAPALAISTNLYPLNVTHLYGDRFPPFFEPQKARINIQDWTGTFYPDLVVQVPQELRTDGTQSRTWSYERYLIDGKAPQLHYAHTVEEADFLCRSLFLDRRVRVLGFDAEFATYNAKGTQKVATIQLASETDILVAHIVRFEKYKLPSSMRDILDSSDVIKTGRGVLNDAMTLAKSFGASTRAMIDLADYLTAILSVESIQRRGLRIPPSQFPQPGLALLVERYTGLKLNKSGGDWLRSPLSQASIDYAANDAYAGIISFHALETLRRKLCPDLARPPTSGLDYNAARSKAIPASVQKRLDEARFDWGTAVIKKSKKSRVSVGEGTGISGSTSEKSEGSAWSELLLSHSVGNSRVGLPSARSGAEQSNHNIEILKEWLQRKASMKKTSVTPMGGSAKKRSLSSRYPPAVQNIQDIFEYELKTLWSGLVARKNIIDKPVESAKLIVMFARTRPTVPKTMVQLKELVNHWTRVGIQVGEPIVGALILKIKSVESTLISDPDAVRNSTQSDCLRMLVQERSRLKRAKGQDMTDIIPNREILKLAEEDFSAVHNMAGTIGVAEAQLMGFASKARTFWTTHKTDMAITKARLQEKALDTTSVTSETLDTATSAGGHTASDEHAETTSNNCNTTSRIQSQVGTRIDSTIASSALGDQLITSDVAINLTSDDSQITSDIVARIDDTSDLGENSTQDEDKAYTHEELSGADVTNELRDSKTQIIVAEPGSLEVDSTQEQGSAHAHEELSRADATHELDDSKSQIIIAEPGNLKTDKQVTLENYQQALLPAKTQSANLVARRVSSRARLRQAAMIAYRIGKDIESAK